MWAKVHVFGIEFNINFHKYFLNTRSLADSVAIGTLIIVVVLKTLLTKVK